MSDVTLKHANRKTPSHVPVVVTKTSPVAKPGQPRKESSMQFVGPTKLLMLSTAVSLGALALGASPAFASAQPLTITHTPVLTIVHTPLPKPGPDPFTNLYADGGPAHVYVTGYGFPKTAASR
jgi:hypothetical protein